jgi:hypothetical protein
VDCVRPVHVELPGAHDEHVRSAPSATPGVIRFCVCPLDKARRSWNAHVTIAE